MILMVNSFTRYAQKLPHYKRVINTEEYTIKLRLSFLNYKMDIITAPVSKVFFGINMYIN